MSILRIITLQISEKRSKRLIEYKCDQCEKIYTKIYSDREMKSDKNTFCSKKCLFKSLQKNGICNEKMRKNNLENYGVEHKSQLSSVKEKRENTCLERYGSKNTFQVKEFKEKARLTLKLNYGVENPSQSKSLREKIKKSCLEKYGVENPLNPGEIRDLIDYKENFKRSHETRKKNGSYKKSKIEDEFYNLLCELFGGENVERQVKVHKWVIDFYIGTIDTYVQFDGVYWHGLDRTVEAIKEFKSSRDKVIYETFLRDQEQNEWFNENCVKLVRVTDVEFKRDGSKMKDFLSELKFDT